MNSFGNLGRSLAIAATGLALLAGSALLIRMLVVARTPRVTSQPPEPAAQQLYHTTPPPTSATQTDPTINWKTYTSKLFGFEIRYPQDMLLDPNAIAPDSGLLSNIKIHRPDDADSIGRGAIEVSVSSTPLNFIKTALERSTKSKVFQIEINRRQGERIEWLHWVSYENLTLFESAVLLSYGNLTYGIYAHIDNSNPKKDAFVKLYNQILSTFKFT